MFPIGVQVYSVRDHAEKDFRATLAKIKEFGYDGVEFAGLYGIDAKTVRVGSTSWDLSPFRLT